MDQQLALFDTPKPLPSKFSVFLAILPDHFTAQRIAEFTEGLRLRYGLRGKPRPTHHLHITLHHLGYYNEVPEHVVRTVGLACETVVAVTPAFDVKLDAVLSFGNRPGNHPLVLINRGGGTAELLRFRQALGRELAKQAFPGIGDSSFTPHFTLLYDKQRILEEPVDSVSWRVGEIALVRSETGKTLYEPLGRWKLGMGNYT